MPRRTARHQENRYVNDIDDMDDMDDMDGAVTRPMIRRSWTYLDSRPFSMPPPPSPWRRPWSRLSRDQLVRPALIVGFLAAAGVGVWSSGWSPWDRGSAGGTSPASSSGGLLAGHDVAPAPSRAPVAAGADAKGPAGRRKAAEGEKGSGAEGAGRKGRVPGRDPARVPPAGRAAERALSGAGDIRDEWVERVERAAPVKKPVRPVERAGRHREGGGSTRTGSGRGGAAAAAPRTGAAAPEAGAGRASGGSGHESGRGTSGGTGRGERSAGRSTASTGGDAGSARTAGRPRSGAQEGGSQPRAGRVGTPSASRNRPPGTGGSTGISAAYACRHLPSGDWRHAYCVRVWNDYKSRNGLP
ncbi:hypothetical protein [Streptosporangium sp. NPDC048865]|uniref:hypothetical protein n=1 Tax=Streptosporangium sp. NPDC048865 TaxID=3155766 RepID=UPI00343B0B1B